MAITNKQAIIKAFVLLNSINQLPPLAIDANKDDVLVYLENLKQANDRMPSVIRSGWNPFNQSTHSDCILIRDKILRYRNVLIKKAIDADEQGVHFPALKNDATQIEVLAYLNTLRSKNPGLGDHDLAEAHLTPAYAIDLREFILTHRIKLIWKKIATDKDLTHFPVLHADATREELIDYLNVLREKYPTLRDHDFDADSLSQAHADVLKKHLIQHRLLCQQILEQHKASLLQAILEDENSEHFAQRLKPTATDDEVRIYLESLRKAEPDHYGSIPFGDKMPPDSQIEVIKKALRSRQEHFVVQSLQKVMPKSAYPIASLPKLRRLVTAVTSENQSVLINPTDAKLIGLFHAKTRHESLAAAAQKFGFNFANKAYILKDFLAEIHKTQKYLSFCNSRIAETLVEQSIDIDLNSIAQWNKIIIKVKKGDPFDEGIIKQLVNAAQNGTTSLTQRQKKRLIVALKIAQADISAQHDGNKYIMAQLNRQSGKGRTAALCVLARFSKQPGIHSTLEENALDDNEINALIEQLAKYPAPSYEKLQTVFHDASQDPLKTAVSKIINWQTVLTPEQYAYIQSQYNQDKLISDKQYKREIQRQKALITKHEAALTAFIAADEKTHVELERLASLNAFAWIKPRERVFARQRAIEFYDQIVHLEKVCAEICRGLETRRKMYQSFLDSIPIQQEDSLNNLRLSAVSQHKKALEVRCGKIDEMLVRYQRVHRRLLGDPTYRGPNRSEPDVTAQNGILGVVGEARELAVVANHVLDYPASRKEGLARLVDDHFDKDPPKGGTSVSVMKSVNAEVLHSADELKEGTFRLHGQYAVSKESVRGKVEKIIAASAYIEERGKPRISITPTGKRFEQSITMTVVRFPAPVVEKQNNFHDIEELKEAQVRFAVEMAAELLAKMGDRLPTPNNPIVLHGTNQHELAMLWTALVELGDAHPRYKFKENAIRVDSLYFDPSTQKKWYGGYASTSVYKTLFSGITGHSLHRVKQEVKHFYEKGFGSLKEQKQAKLTEQNITTLYRQTLAQDIARGHQAISESPLSPAFK